MSIWLWVAFVALILFFLALDLGVLNRRPHVISFGESLGWTALWVSIALLFNVGIYFLYEYHLLGIGLSLGHELGGRQAALQFLTGYLIEKSLSLDNIFVIAVILAYFHVPAHLQHRLLFWGVLGALVMRGVMISLGVMLVESFDWMIYVFGGLLLLTAVKMLVTRHDSMEPGNNPLIRLVRRLYPVSTDAANEHFFTRLDGRRAVSSLFLALVVVESSDLLFAVDSIPAIFAVTTDPFIIYTSNVFAILGLRSLYFLLAVVMRKFHYLKISLVFILAFVGIKMLVSHHYPIPVVVSLVAIVAILAVGVLASLISLWRQESMGSLSPLAGELTELAQLTYRQGRRIVILLVGSTILLVGVALLVLPGPGVLIIALGLAALATEFVWARSLLRRLKTETARVPGILGRLLGLKPAAGASGGVTPPPSEDEVRPRQRESGGSDQ